MSFRQVPGAAGISKSDGAREPAGALSRDLPHHFGVGGLPPVLVLLANLFSLGDTGHVPARLSLPAGSW